MLPQALDLAMLLFTVPLPPWTSAILPAWCTFPKVFLSLSPFQISGQCQQHAGLAYPMSSLFPELYQDSNLFAVIYLDDSMSKTEKNHRSISWFAQGVSFLTAQWVCTAPDSATATAPASLWKPSFLQTLFPKVCLASHRDWEPLTYRRRYFSILFLINCMVFSS